MGLILAMRWRCANLARHEPGEAVLSAEPAPPPLTQRIAQIAAEIAKGFGEKPLGLPFREAGPLRNLSVA